MTGTSIHTLEIKGDASLRNVHEIAALLRQAMADHSTIAVVTERLASIDVSIVQLLVAARKSASAAGKTLILRAPVNGVLHRFLLQTGFVTPDGQALTPEGDFWTHTSPTEQPA